jgi:hypothetical protein
MGNEYVAVENTLHQGTRFTFSIPYEVSTIQSTQNLLILI